MVKGTFLCKSHSDVNPYEDWTNRKHKNKMSTLSSNNQSFTALKREAKLNSYSDVNIYLWFISGLGYAQKDLVFLSENHI